MKKADNVLKFVFLLTVFVASIAINQAWCQEPVDKSQKLASMEDVMKSGKPGTITLTSEKQGSESYTATSDCEVIISSCLQTYGEAELSVTVNEEKVITWNRQNDQDPSKLIVKGQEIAESNVDVGGGDFTPTTQTTKLQLKKGDKVILNLSGSFGNANAHLSITGPGIENQNPAPGTAGEIGKPGETVSGSGGGFLWKPVSDSRGGICAILLPSKYRHEQFNKKLSINGQENEVKDWPAKYANGNRMHIFLKKQGKSYGGPVTIIFGLANGGSVKWEVPDGAKRTEK